MFSSCNRIDEEEQQEQITKLNENLPLVPTEKKEKWDDSKKKCVSSKENECCLPPPPTISNPAVVAIRSAFVTAFNNNDLANFFLNEDYLQVWDLNPFLNIVNSVINGSYRVILVHNTSNGNDYYLFGPTAWTNSQIESNPELVLY